MGAENYLSMARYIGDNPSEHEEIVRVAVALKEAIRSNFEFLDMVREFSDPALLDTYQVAEFPHFWNDIQAVHHSTVDRLYYPDRLIFLAEGLFELAERSFDDIFNAHVGLLKKAIDSLRNKGAPETETSADSLGAYIRVYRKLTGHDPT